MKSITRTRLYLLTTLLFIATISSNAIAATSNFGDLSGNPGLRSESALVIDSSGNVVYGKDAKTLEGDRDYRELIYFSVPAGHSEKLHVRIAR